MFANKLRKKMWQLVSCVAAAVVASVPTLVPVPELARVTATGAHSSHNLNIQQLNLNLYFNCQIASLSNRQ